MIVETFAHTPGGEWSINAFPDLDSPNTAIFVFGARSLQSDTNALSQLANAYPQSVKVGCSTAGEIRNTEIHDGSLVVAVVKFESTRVSSASQRLEEMDQSRETGRQLGERLAEESLAGVLVFSKGLEVNGSALARGFGDTLSDDVVVTGGLAGDGQDFGRTWTFDGDTLDENLVRAVGLYGDDVTISHGAQGGWTPFGPERTVTRSGANILHELDGEPALDVYNDYLGEQAANLPASALRFPLALVSPNSPHERIVRTILGIDEDDGSMTFAGEIPEGSSARFMKTTVDRLLEGASEAAELCNMMADHDEQGDIFGLAVSCVGRRLVLKKMASRELEHVRTELPSSTHLAGFYSYGELSPSAPGKPCALHNQTMTLTAISERRR